MLKAMQRLNARLAAFLEQREAVVLRIRCGAAEAPVVLRAIQGVDEGSGSDLFWVFPEDFVEPISYAEAVVQSFVRAHEELRDLQKKEGLAVASPVPDDALVATRPPVARLRTLMMFSRSLLPVKDGGFAAWALFPLEVQNPVAWSIFNTQLMEHEWPFPWCHHLRVYLRESPAIVPPVGVPPPRSEECSVDLGPDVIAQGFVEDADDESLPLQTRMNAVLILGGLDQSHRRFDAAIKKYDLVLRYAMAADVPVLACAALNQMAETWKMQGDRVRALGCCNAALVAGSAQAITAGPALLNASVTAGHLATDSALWPEAETYFTGACALAEVQSDPRTRLQCLAHKGFAQYQQGRVDDAVSTWQAALKGAHQGGHEQEKINPLEFLRQHHRQTKNRVALVEVERELAETRARISGKNPH